MCLFLSKFGIKFGTLIRTIFDALAEGAQKNDWTKKLNKFAYLKFPKCFSAISNHSLLH